MEESEETKTSAPKLMEKLRANPWILSTFVLGIITIVLLLGAFNPGMTGNVISDDAAAERLVDFLNTRSDGTVTLDSVSEDSGLYKVDVGYQGDVIPVYTTLDGKYFIQGVVPLSGEAAPQQQAAQDSQPQEVVKSDRPIVELFVMTHCPYGTQAEKGFLPAMVGLAGKADISVKFVHYFLHDPENDETPVQICIREEQGAKYNAYLKEFLVEGDTEASLTKVGIDRASLDDCIANRADGYYAADSALSEGYGVRGSPTLVVNGQIVNSGRSADAYVSTICSAFNNAPAECSTLNLDTDTPGPGFGYGTTSSVASAQC
jgi:protein-disulfide isomerase